MPPFEKEINRQLIVDKIAELLLQLRVITPSTVVTNIEFGETIEDLVKCKIFTRKEQGVKVLIHNAA